LRSYLEYVVFRIIALSGYLPPRAGYRLAGWCGRLTYRLMPNLRRDLTSNTGRVLGPEATEKQVQAVVRRQCTYVVKNLYDLFRLGRLTNEDVEKVTRVEGREHLFEELANGRGVIAISAHIGSSETVAQIPSVFGVPLTGMVLKTGSERRFRFTHSLRRSHGLNLVPTDQSPIALFRALKRNEIVALPCDQDLTGNGREVAFFGARTRLPDGPLRIAYRTGVSVLPVFALRLPDDTFLLEFEPPLALPHTDDREADLDAGMALVVSVLERRIRAHPEQWLVTGRVWPEEQNYVHD
jgi:lauroyl/myristoyl acyltransferase